MYQPQQWETPQQPGISAFQTVGSSLFEGEVRLHAKLSIEGIEDIVKARHCGRLLAQEIGFSTTRATLVTTVISELARNIVLYAKSGEIELCRVEKDLQKGILIHAVDQGPGIPNIQRALMSGYSSSGGLGMGLPGVRNMADEFDLQSQPGEGTRVSVNMWLNSRLDS